MPNTRQEEGITPSDLRFSTSIKVRTHQLTPLGILGELIPHWSKGIIRERVGLWSGWHTGVGVSMRGCGAFKVKKKFHIDLTQMSISTFIVLPGLTLYV